MNGARDIPPYPLCFEPIYKAKVWGGRRLETLGRTLPAGNIGESWELADLDATSPTGGGGGAERSVIANGPLAGRTLHDVMDLWGPALMGRLEPTPSGGFPLLVKFLDAGENLSVQVHPGADYARTHPGAHLKSEAWYILDATPGSVIYKGVHQGVTRERFRAAIADNRVEELLIKIEVKPGQCHYLPSGTCHALGAGVLVAEVQTPSDTTFRVYDWGRTGRQLHVEEALACIEFSPPNVAAYEKRSHIAGMFTTVSRLCQCEHFRLEKVRMTEGYEQELPYDQPAVWMVLEGKGRLLHAGANGTTTFERGRTLLIPAGVENASVKLDTDTTWLEITFPQALADRLA